MTGACDRQHPGTTSETGQQRYTGATFGSEADWDPNFADNGRYGPFIGHYVYSVDGPPYNWRVDINFSNVYDEANAALSPITAAPSPGLGAFTGRVGRIVHYHGMNDSVVPPDGSIAYLHALTFFEKYKHARRHVRQARRQAHARPRDLDGERLPQEGPGVPPPVPATGRGPLRRSTVPARSAAGHPSRPPRTAMPIITR